MKYKKCRNKGHYDLLHRKIMEEYLGRKLLSTEVVHHINDNKLDNRIENLQVMDKNKHCSITMLGRKLSNECKQKISLSLIGNQRHKGIPHDDLTKAKISASLIGNQRRKNTTVSQETRKKISDSMKLVRKDRFWSTKKK